MMEVARLLFFFVRAVITVSEARAYVVIKSPKYVTPITVCRTERAAFERNGIELTMIEKKGERTNAGEHVRDRRCNTDAEQSC